MKKRIYAILTTLIVFALVMTGCSTDSSSDNGGEKSKEASLTGLKLGDDTVTPGTAIAASEYDTMADLSTLSAQQEATYSMMVTSKEVAVTATPSAKAKVEVGVTESNAKPTSFAAPGTITIKPNGYVVIKVTAEDGTTIKYYAVKIELTGTNTALTSITLASGEPKTTNARNRGETIAAIQELIIISLSSADANQVEVTLTKGGAFNGTMKIVVKDSPTDADFQSATAYNANSKPKFDFVDGDKLYVQMTAENGITVMYYGFEFSIGSDATAKSITFETQYSYGADSFGTPKPSLSEITTAEGGIILMPILQPMDGFNIAVTANDPLATIVFGKANAGDSEEDWTADAKTLRYEEKGFLGVKIISANEKVTNYYKISLDLKPSMEIFYGTPKLYNTADETDTDYIDPLWDAISGVPIARQNYAQSSEEFFLNPTTVANAKLYWDEDGLWLYVDVKGPLSAAPGYTSRGSSVEIFINEAYPTVSSGNSFTNIGGQYRLNSWGETSGDPTVAVNDFNALNRYKTFETSDGYVVMFQAPWRCKETYPVVDNKEISLEIQVNAANLNGIERSGVLKWYNTTSNSYQNPSVLAPGKLLPKPAP